MKKRSFASACLLLIVFLLTSCDTGRRVTVAQSRQPKFIKDIYLSGHSKAGVASNAVDTRKIAKTQPESLSYNDYKQPEPPAETAEDRSSAPATVPVIRRKRRNADPEAEAVAMVAPAESEANEIEPVGLKFADMMGLSGKDLRNNLLYRFISKWYGTHYRLGGQDESGIDCSGFARKLYGDVYGVDLNRTAMEQYKSCKRQKKTIGAEEGDLVFFRQHGKRITHVGVYLANDYFVHSSTSQGVVISNLKEDYWRRHFAGMGKMTKGGAVTGL